MINVKDFGAVGDKVTDDSAAINTAIDTVSAAGGGTIYFPVGRYVVGSTVILKSNVILEGDGIGRTVIHGRAGTSHNLLETEGFASLTGTNSPSGPLCFGLRNLTINGNRWNRTGSGLCLNIYGYDYELTNVEIYDSRGIGFYSEWAIHAGVPVTPYGKDTMEAHITGLRVFRSASDGMIFNGPHDTIMRDVLTFINAGRGAVFGEADGLYTAGGVMVDQLHSYGNTGWGVVTSTLIFAGIIESESNAGGGIQINAWGGRFQGGTLLAWGNTGAGVEFNAPSSSTSVIANDNSGDGVHLYSSNNQLSINSYSNGGNGISYGGSSGNNTVSPCRTVANTGKGIYLQGNDNRVLGLCGMSNQQGGVVVNGSIGGLRLDGELSVNTGTQISFGTLGVPCIIDLLMYTSTGQTAWSGNPGNNHVRIATSGASNMPLSRSQT